MENNPKGINPRLKYSHDKIDALVNFMVNERRTVTECQEFLGCARNTIKGILWELIEEGRIQALDASEIPGVPNHYAYYIAVNKNAWPLLYHERANVRIPAIELAIAAEASNYDSKSLSLANIVAEVIISLGYLGSRAQAENENGNTVVNEQAIRNIRMRLQDAEEHFATVLSLIQQMLSIPMLWDIDSLISITNKDGEECAGLWDSLKNYERELAEFKHQLIPVEDDQ